MTNNAKKRAEDGDKGSIVHRVGEGRNTKDQASNGGYTVK